MMRWIYTNNKWNLDNNNLTTTEWLDESNEDTTPLEFWSKCINGSIYTTTTSLNDIYPDLKRINAIWAKSWNGEVVQAVLSSGGTVSFTNPHLQQTGDIIGLLDLAGDIRGEYSVISYNTTSVTINQTQPIVNVDTNIWVILYGETRTATYIKSDSYIDISVPDHKSSGRYWKIRADETSPVLDNIKDGVWIDNDTIRYNTFIPLNWSATTVTVRQDWDNIDIYGPIPFTCVNYASSLTIDLNPGYNLEIETDQALNVNIDGQLLELRVISFTGTTIEATGSIDNLLLGSLSGIITRPFSTISDWTNILINQNLLDPKLLDIISRNIIMLRTSTGLNTTGLTQDLTDLTTWGRTQLGHFQPEKSLNDEFSNYSEIDLIDFENIDITLEVNKIYVDQIQLKPGQLIALMGQTDLTQRGIWKVDTTGLTQLEIDPIKYIVHVKNGVLYNATKWETIRNPWGKWDEPVLLSGNTLGHSLEIWNDNIEKDKWLQISGETKQITWKWNNYVWYKDEPFTQTGEIYLKEPFILEKSDPRLIRNKVEYNILSELPFSDLDYSEIYNTSEYSVDLADLETLGGTSGYTWSLQNSKLVRVDLDGGPTFSWGQPGQMPTTGTSLNSIYLNSPSVLEGTTSKFWIVDETELLEVDPITSSAITVISTKTSTIPYIRDNKIEDIYIDNNTLWFTLINNNANDINFGKSLLVNLPITGLTINQWQMPDDANVVQYLTPTNIYNNTNYIYIENGVIGLLTTGSTFNDNYKLELTLKNTSFAIDARQEATSSSRAVTTIKTFKYGKLCTFNLATPLSTNTWYIKARVRFTNIPTKKDWILGLRTTGTLLEEYTLSGTNIQVDKWYTIWAKYSGAISNYSLNILNNTTSDLDFNIWVDGIEVNNIPEYWIDKTNTLSGHANYLYTISDTIQQHSISGATITTKNILALDGIKHKIRARYTAGRTKLWVITDGLLRRTSTTNVNFWSGWDYNDESILVVGQGGNCLKWRPAFGDFKFLETKTRTNINAITSQINLIQDRDWFRYTTRQIYYAVGDRGMILKSIDAGNSWNYIQSPTFLSLQDVDFYNNTGVIVGEAGYIIYTDNTEWIEIKSNRSLRWNSVKLITQDIILAVGESGQIGIYQRNGLKWDDILGKDFKIEYTELTYLTNELTDIKIQNGKTAWVTGKRGLLFSLDIESPVQTLFDFKFWSDTSQELVNFTSLTLDQSKLFIGTDSGDVLDFNPDNFNLNTITGLYDGIFNSLGSGGLAISSLEWSNSRNSIIATTDESNILKWEFVEQDFTGLTSSSILINSNNEFALLESGLESVIVRLSVSGNTAIYSPEFSATTVSLLKPAGELDPNLSSNFLPRLIFTDYFIARKIRQFLDNNELDVTANVPVSEAITRIEPIDGDTFTISKKLGQEWNWIANETYLWTGNPLSGNWNNTLRCTTGNTTIFVQSATTTTFYFTNTLVQSGDWINITNTELNADLLVNNVSSSSITFNQIIPEHIVKIINTSGITLTNLNLSTIGWTGLTTCLDAHPMGLAYEIEVGDNIIVKGKYSAISAYWYLGATVTCPGTTGTTISYTGEQYGPDYTLLGLLEPSLGFDANYELEFTGISGITWDNTPTSPTEYIFTDNLIWLGSGHTEIVQNIIPGTFHDIMSGSTLIMDRVFIKSVTLVDNRWKIETDSKPYFGLTPITNGTPIILKPRKTMGEVSSDLRLTDNRGIALTYFDLTIPGVRSMRTQFDIRLSGFAYANILANNEIVREKVGLIISEDSDGLLKARLLSWTNDPSLAWRPSDVMIAGVDSLPRIAVGVEEENYNIIDDTFGLKNISERNVSFRLTNDLTISMINSMFPWVLNADIKNAVIGIDSDNRLVWYTGDWLCGRWLDGTWYNGTVYSISWLNGEFYSNLTSEANGVWEIKETGLLYSKWLNGAWYNGTWYNGTWYNGTWYNGTHNTGDWKTGIWVNGLWLDGTFSGGRWIFGTWQGGKFNCDVTPAVWEAGRWFDGDFENGVWKSGIWQSRNNSSGVSRFGTRATLSQPAIWENGVWRSGEFHCSLRQDAAGNPLPSGADKNSVWKNGVWMDGYFYGGTFELGSWEAGVWYKGVMGKKSRAISATKGTDGNLYWVDLEFDTAHYYVDPTNYTQYYPVSEGQFSDERQSIQVWGKLEQVSYWPYEWAEEFGHNLDSKKWIVSNVIDSKTVRINIPQDLYNSWTTGLGWIGENLVAGPYNGVQWNGGDWKGGIFKWGVWKAGDFPQGYFSGIWNGQSMGVKDE